MDVSSPKPPPTSKEIADACSEASRWKKENDEIAAAAAAAAASSAKKLEEEEAEDKTQAMFQELVVAAVVESKDNDDVKTNDDEKIKEEVEREKEEEVADAEVKTTVSLSSKLEATSAGGAEDLADSVVGTTNETIVFVSELEATSAGGAAELELALASPAEGSFSAVVGASAPVANDDDALVDTPQKEKPDESEPRKVFETDRG